MVEIGIPSYFLAWIRPWTTSGSKSQCSFCILQGGKDTISLSSPFVRGGANSPRRRTCSAICWNHLFRNVSTRASTMGSLFLAGPHPLNFLDTSNLWVYVVCECVYICRVCVWVHSWVDSLGKQNLTTREIVFFGTVEDWYTVISTAQFLDIVLQHLPPPLLRW